MKNLKSQKNIIFLSSKKVALVVFNTICNKNNVLFANEVSVDQDNIQAKLSNLLTNAANFLGSNIKSANIVFEDFDIENLMINDLFDKCTSKEEVIKSICADARIEGKFVNNVLFNTDNLDFSKPILCQAIVSKYSNYSTFKKIVSYCNVKVLSATNIATLLNTNKDEIVMSITKDKSVACHYLNNNLSKITNLNINFENITKALADKFNTNIEKINKETKIANILVKNTNYDFDLAWSYDLKNKSLSSIKAVDFVKAWKEELLNQIMSSLHLNNLDGIKVIANNELNNFNSTNIKNSIVGLDSLSDKIIVAFNNINRIAEIESQAKFESQYESEYERVLA